MSLYLGSTRVDQESQDISQTINSKANDNEVVHITGNETISGTKTFTNEPYLATALSPTMHIVNTEWDSSLLPDTSTPTNRIFFEDKNNVFTGYVQNHVNPEAGRTISIGVRNRANTEWADFSIGWDNNDKVFSRVFTPNASDNSNNIATTEYVNIATSVVHKTGTETITGMKTFVGDVYQQDTTPSYFMKNTDIDWTAQLSSTNFNGRILFRDKNDISIGFVQSMRYNDGRRTCEMGTRNKANTSWTAIHVGFDTNNNAFATAPTPVNANENSTQIATTHWVHGFGPTGSGWSMPSNRYIDLTLGTNGSTYTAPANGWFYVNKSAGTPGFNPFIAIRNITNSMVLEHRPGGSGPDLLIRLFAPVKKEDVVAIDYDAVGTTHQFRFYFAEGAA